MRTYNPYLAFQVRVQFALLEGPDFLRLSDLSRNTIVSTGFQVQGDPQYFVYDKFETLPDATYYWFLGKEFRGDMVSFLCAQSSVTILVLSYFVYFLLLLTSLPGCDLTRSLFRSCINQRLLTGFLRHLDLPLINYSVSVVFCFGL